MSLADQDVNIDEIIRVAGDRQEDKMVALFTALDVEFYRRHGGAPTDFIVKRLDESWVWLDCKGVTPRNAESNYFTVSVRTLKRLMRERGACEVLIVGPDFRGVKPEDIEGFTVHPGSPNGSGEPYYLVPRSMGQKLWFLR